MQEDADNLEVHRKIIELANAMQYDDDVEESQVKTNFQKASTLPAQKQTDQATEVNQKAEQQEDSDDEIIDDVQMLIERQNTAHDGISTYLMEDDPKA